jgi:hypothetical protein
MPSEFAENTVKAMRIRRICSRKICVFETTAKDINLSISPGVFSTRIRVILDSKSSYEIGWGGKKIVARYYPFRNSSLFRSTVPQKISVKM